MKEWLSLFVAILALGATTFNVIVTRSTFQANIFAQFQQEYSVVATQFPTRLHDPTFRPPRGTEDYKKLEDYWIFAYAEWFQTGRKRSFWFEDLWADYYSGLVQDATEIPSLRYVLEDMLKDEELRRKDMKPFFAVVRQLAASRGHPLEAGD